MSRSFVICVALIAGVSSSAFAAGMPSLDTSIPKLGPSSIPALSFVASEGEGSQRTRTRSDTRASKAPIPAGSPMIAKDDEDDDNARAPALPDNELGKGQETGGPARMRIPN